MCVSPVCIATNVTSYCLIIPFWSCGGGGSQERKIDVASDAMAWKETGGLEGAVKQRRY